MLPRSGFPSISHRFPRAPSSPAVADLILVRHKIMKRNLILPLMLIAFASQQLTAEKPKSVAQSSSEGLVSDLYKLDEKKQSPFSQTKDHDLVTKDFSQPLTHLIWKYSVQSTGEV